MLKSHRKQAPWVISSPFEGALETVLIGKKYLKEYWFSSSLETEILQAVGRSLEETPNQILPCLSRLKKLGSLDWTKVVVNHQGWRLITCIWLHAGVIHLLANMLSLVFIGIRLEQPFGFVRIGILYLVSRFGGSVLSSLFIRSNISVGASGALFGLLSAMLAELITNKVWYAYVRLLYVFFRDRITRTDLIMKKSTIWICPA